MRVVISKSDLFAIIDDVKDIRIIIVPFQKLAGSFGNEYVVFESNLSLMWLCENRYMLFEASFGEKLR